LQELYAYTLENPPGLIWPLLDFQEKPIKRMKSHKNTGQKKDIGIINKKSPLCFEEKIKE